MNKFFTLIFVFTALFAKSQSIHFKQYTTIGNGLSQSVIISSYQDSLGYLWLGTQNGLNRFDGYNFKVYLHSLSDTNSISNNWIFSIVEDKNQNLWIGTKNGLNIYSRKTDNFKKFAFSKNNNQSIRPIVYGLGKTHSGNILINTLKALYIVNPITNDYEEIKIDILSDNSIHDFQLPVIEDKAGNIWMGTDAGLFIYNPETKFKKQINEKGENGMSNNLVYSICQDNTGDIWVGTANGLDLFSSEFYNIKESYTFSGNNGITDNVIYSIIFDENRGIYAGTNFGVLHINKDTAKGLDYQYYNADNSGLSHNIVYSLLIDKSDNLWVGTLKELSEADLKPKKFKLYQKNTSNESVNLLDNLIASIYKQNDSIIWIGNWGKGLNILNRKSGKIEYYSSAFNGNHFIPNDYVHVIFANHKSEIMMGTRDGLLLYNSKTGSFERLSKYFNYSKINNLENHRIFRIIQDKAANYWIATENGIYCYNENFEEVYHFNTESTPQKISNNLVYNVVEDHEGLIWIATSLGLNCFNPQEKTIKQYVRQENNPNSICDNFVVSLCPDVNGNLWIGTQTGADYFNKKEGTFTYYSKQNGLPDNLIYEISEDKNNDIWFATSNGLVKKELKTGQFIHFTLFDGLQSNEFNINAIYKSPDSEIFIGGMNGVNSFYPDSLHFNLQIPPICITKFEVLNHAGKLDIPIDNTTDVYLSYEDDEFTIEFAAMDYTNTEQNQFAYKITGATNDWISIENRHFVTFSKLAPGNYTFYVKGTNNDGVWGDQPKFINIHIKPPFWKTRLAYFVYVVMLILLVILIIRYRLYSITKENEMLERKVVERTRIIEEQKDKIEKAHFEIKSSINYAARIQNALFPSAKNLDLFAQNFLLYIPRDIVSGDFCYVRTTGIKKYFLVADCTGHGVPGAFMSVLSLTLINDIITQNENQTSAEILEKLRQNIKYTLKQNNPDVTTKDGLDIAICIYNTETGILNYAGANNTALIARKREVHQELNADYSDGSIKIIDKEKVLSKNILLELQATKNPVGIFTKEIPFSDIHLALDKNDLIYLYSDGYSDQFNGITNQKYTRNRFKQLILKNSTYPLDKQKLLLESEFYQWKESHFQVDDILVFGIKLFDM
jgi:ligand-binding sensor domain-containing protein/serine phosphatase RsbU (regulator of sigma subunit)